MPASMTGFGRGIIKSKQGRYLVEARSVNSRYCEVRVSAPKELLELEHELAAQVRNRFARGKFDLYLRYEPVQKSALRYEEKQVIQVWKELDRLRRKLKLAQPPSLESALQSASGGSGSSEAMPDDSDAQFKKAAKMALDKLSQFRVREGNSLVSDIEKRRKELGRTTEKLAKLLPEATKRRYAKLRERMDELLKGKGVDSNRVEAEIALIVDRADVTEEIVRLRTHLEELGAVIGSGEGIGRKLDFLVQELNREVNTIGSKSTDVEMTNEVIFLKTELEKIREQAQNLE